VSNSDILKCLLDINNTKEIEAYEKALYKAFSRSYIKTLDKIWTINHKDKIIKTIVDYYSQQIVVAKVNDKIVSAIAINYDMSNTQLGLMNFKIDNEKNCCEALHIFSLLDYSGGPSILQDLSRIMFEKIKEKNIEKVYGTCSAKRLHSYERMGFRCINETVFSGEKKYLLELDSNITLLFI